MKKFLMVSFCLFFFSKNCLGAAHEQEEIPHHSALQISQNRQQVSAQNVVSCALDGACGVASLLMILGTAIYGDPVQIGIGAVAGATGTYHFGKSFYKKLVVLTGTPDPKEERLVDLVATRFAAARSRKGSTEYFPKKGSGSSKSKNPSHRNLQALCTVASSSKENELPEAKN